MIEKLRQLVEWDEFSAYMLGYILGDGCIHERESYVSKDKIIKERIPVVVITSSDIADMEKLANMGNFRLKIKQASYKNDGIMRKAIGTGQIHSKQWYDFLLVHGIVPRKSLNGCKILFPDATNIRHFLRGLFDADGCVCRNTPKLLRVYILGHPSYISQIEEMKILAWKSFLRKGGNLMQLYLTKKSDVLNFYCMVYDRASLFNKRKREVFESWLAERNLSNLIVK